MNNDDENAQKSSRSADYEVGYKKPPKKSQFRPGQSGNRNGRSKGHRNMKTMFKEQLDGTMAIKEAGRVKKVPRVEAMFMLLVQKALQGDPKAIANVMKLADRFQIGEEPMPEKSPYDIVNLSDLEREQFMWLLNKSMGEKGKELGPFPLVEKKPLWDIKQ
jgi:hypothetical protein